MRAWTVFLKSLREQMQDWWVIALTVLTAPAFVLLYWLMTGGGSTTYGLLVYSEDDPTTLEDGTSLDSTEGIVDSVQAIAYPTGQPMLDVTMVGSRDEALSILEAREAAALLVIPEGFAASAAGEGPATVEIVGDATNPYYTVAAVMAHAAAAAWVQGVTGREPLVDLVETPMGSSMERTEFEYYVPGIFMIAIMMMIFSASISVAREVEAGTLARLRLTRMTSLDFLLGVSGTQIVVGLVSLAVTLLVARALGFRSEGPLWGAFAIGALTALPVIGLGLVVASFSKTVVRAFLLANLPFMFIMFFSGAVYPMNKIGLFEIAGRTVGLFDFLPTTHSVIAVNRILTLGAGPSDVLYEIVALAVLSVLYFAAGVVLFHGMHLRPRGG